MKNLKIIIFILVALAIVLQLFLMNGSQKELSTKPTISISTFSLYDITKHIAGDSVRLVNILPFGVDPHSFEPTPKLMSEIEKSNLIIYSGAGLEPWIHGFSFKGKAIDMSQFVNLRELDADEHEFHDHHDHQCAHNKIDPHYWLDFGNMKTATQLITKELIQLSPKYKELYEKNSKVYIAMLEKLDKNYKDSLSSCKSKKVIVNHNAIGYLSHNYSFEVDSLSGLSPEAEPSAKDITRIMKHIKEEGVTTIFFENFVNNSVITSIAKDTNIKLEVFQPLGNITAEEASKELTYEKIMYLNLDKLTKALMCK